MGRYTFYKQNVLKSTTHQITHRQPKDKLTIDKLCKHTKGLFDHFEKASVEFV